MARGIQVRPRASVIAIAALFAAIACAGDSSGPRAPRPDIASTLVSQNPHNNLSAIVSFVVSDADSARLLYRSVPDPLTRDAADEGATPFYPVRADAGRIVALGLKPNTSYDIFVEAAGVGVDTSAKMLFRSASLPLPLAGLRLEATGALTSGYTLTDFTSGATAYIIALDNSGNVCWYREFAVQPGENALDAEQRSNGNYTVFLGASIGWQPTPGGFHEVTPAGDFVRSYAAGAPYYTDPHEILLDFGASGIERVHLLGYSFRRLDLTSLGGKSDQLVAGHVILRQSASGGVEFLWDAWDHFTIADWIFVPPGLALMPSIDFDHPNSLEIDGQGNYVVSFASLGEITKIDGVTGRILWRFGGRNNQFTIVGDPLAGFGIQHDVRLLTNGNLLFLDNGTMHRPQESRAVEYRLDLGERTATLVWEYRHSPPVFAPFAGSVQRLANGNTFVAFGADSRVAEVSPNGSVVWEAQLTDDGRKVPFFYRARRLASLYRFTPQ